MKKHIKEIFTNYEFKVDHTNHSITKEIWRTR